MITKQESQSITIIRVLSMAFVFLCHYVNWFPRAIFTIQFFNTGVPLFFIISGYLHGQKRIKNTGTWLRDRFISLSVPIYLYYLLGAMLLLLLGKLGSVSFLETVKSFLHLVGILGGSIGELEISHFWFISYIFVCYLITPLFQRMNVSRYAFILIMCLLCAVEIIVMLLFGEIYFLYWIPGAYCYIVGYYLSKHWDRRVTPGRIIALTALLIGVVGFRLGAKKVMDGTRLYDLVIAIYTSCFIAFWLFFMIYWMNEKYTKLRECLSRVCNLIAPYSFEFYITHYCMISGVLSLNELTGNKLINTVVLILAASMLSIVLHRISKPVVLLCKNLLANSEKKE